MSARRLTEDEIVTRLRELAEQSSGGRVLLGIGDDAAVWQPSRSHRSVITTDALVDGVHFTRETMSLEDVGWRTTTANLSDLAAMGARPVLATIALGIPEAVDFEDLLALYRGIIACATTERLVIAGGDLTRAPALTIAMTAVGEVRASSVKRRSSGRPGDAVGVTGRLGASRAGFDIARGRVTLGQEGLREEALRAHRRPRARVREGRWLAASASVHAMMDCSDGLSTDLARLCEASALGARLESIPVAPSALAAAEALREDPRAYALAGGEEYELIFTCAARAFAHLARRFQECFGSPLHRIGTLRRERGIVIAERGEEKPVSRTGWDHFDGG